jgi:prolyl oligopeptidase
MQIDHLRRALTLALLAAPGARALAQNQPAPPATPVRNVPETFFGTTVDDPYRWLESTQDPEVVAWMKAQSEQAFATLRRIEGRDRLRQRIGDLDASAPARVTGVKRTAGGALFYERRGATDDQFKLYARRSWGAPERLVFDPDTLRQATGQPHAINWFEPSPDGRWVALGVSAAGSENAAMRILDTRTLQQVGPEIARAQFGAMAWAPDGRSLYFHRMQALAAGAPATDKYQRSSMVWMPIGGGESDLRTVLTAGTDLESRPSEFPFIEILPSGDVLGYVIDGVSPDFLAFHTPYAALKAGQPAWQRLAGRDDRVTGLTVRGGRVWALSFRDAPRYKLLTGPLKDFSVATARVLVPESERVLTDLHVAKDALYLSLRDGNVKRLQRLGWDDRPAREVALPVLGSFSASTTPHADGAVLELQGWVRARQIYAVDASGRLRNTRLQPAGPFDAPADVETTEVMVTAADGARVPLSIVHRRGVKLDGQNPVMLYGYASYGITEEPRFSYSRLAWMDAGGVFAVANPRGSGVFGRAWHEGGRQATKPNTWRDFIACAEWLVAQRWTNPQRLTIWGGSAGGILVGRAMTERPDLFAAVVPSVGSLDLVRAETTPNGVPNIPEFGSRATEAGFRALLAMSTYHQIKDGTPYPAVLLTHGVNDPRVTVWNSTKTGARLQAATTSGKPVLLRLEFASGHGIGNTKSQSFDEVADVYAFALWQMGVPGWGLKTAG